LVARTEPQRDKLSEDPRARPLSRRDLDPDPLGQFGRWYEEAWAAGGAARPDAFAVATATTDGRPSVRMVLLKEYGERGFVFFTGYESRKGRELAVNPRAALLFHWHELGRQVRVEGPVERVSDEESDAYFASRPEGARLSAAVSRQSEVVSSRDELEQAVAELKRGSGEDVLPRPSRWGGYLVVPESYEFWQHREDRLHDRFQYSREGDGWIVRRLAP
jgi:pyridoxamine 5'-phosphate oxidase